jgi:RHS repeat-associated protein
MVITDANQATVNQYRYDPSGNILYQSETVTQPFKYVGQLGVMAEPNGLYYMRARYYDPQVGRFISEDPIEFDGGDVNLYAYVRNNPVMLTDPWGLCGEQPGYWSNVLTNFTDTNAAIPGALAPSLAPGLGLGMVSSGTTARALNGITAGQYLGSGLRAATLAGTGFTAAETGVIAAGTAAVNYALVSVAWETGVAVGSMISAIPVGNNQTLSGWVSDRMQNFESLGAKIYDWTHR